MLFSIVIVEIRDAQVFINYSPKTNLLAMIYKLNHEDKNELQKKNEFPILLADATVDELSKLSTVCERWTS
jgi:hypothetical protein